MALRVLAVAMFTVLCGCDLQDISASLDRARFSQGVNRVNRPHVAPTTIRHYNNPVTKILS